MPLCWWDKLGECVYPAGTEVSPYVSVILYFASCCELLDMRKYTANGEKEPVEAEAMQAMGHGAKFSVALFYCEIAPGSAPSFSKV